MCVVGRSNGFSRKNRIDSCEASISPGQYVNLILGQPLRVFTCFTVMGLDGLLGIFMYFLLWKVGDNDNGGNAWNRY